MAVLKVRDVICLTELAGFTATANGRAVSTLAGDSLGKTAPHSVGQAGLNEIGMSCSGSAARCSGGHAESQDAYCE